jgi:hypothetical protein
MNKSEMCSQAGTNMFSKRIIYNFTYFVAMTILQLLAETRRSVFIDCNFISRLMLSVAWFEENNVFELSNIKIVG